MFSSVILALYFFSFFPIPSLASIRKHSECHCFPGDSCWPSPSQWSEFNRTVDYRLVATTPIASLCHTNDQFATYNASECDTLRAKWDFPQTHYESSSSIMSRFYTNQSCDPFLAPSAACIIGTYVQYSVRAQSAADVQKTIKFTTAHDIRLVIRNTGHDYLGKSTGAGAVAIWMHHLKDIEFIDYKSSSYTGKAIKVGAGVQIFESNAAASKQGLTVVGGNCRTVGLAGGYSQGGGHGQLVSLYGLAADQVLEWEVVTSTGKLVTATPHNDHKDLWWALSGGGGGTYGVVVSMTSKAHKEMRTATANLTFTSIGVTETTFDDAVHLFLNSTLGPLLDARGAAVWYMLRDAFEITPITLPSGSKKDLQAIMAPLLTGLDQANISYSYFIEEFPTWYSSFETMSPDVNITADDLGGRFIPRSLVDTDSSTLVERFRNIVNYGAVVSGISVNASISYATKYFPTNSVNPAWRDLAIGIVVGMTQSGTNKSLNREGQRLITNVLLPELEELTPNGAAYLNEADPYQPNWKYTFYNDKYDRLLRIKNKYDPRNIFYGTKAVGSDFWVEKADGRLCRA
ncbi:FAD/FMN-containing dehydrogenase [Penicillium verhagenii]|uniref:FAD/FMN-containing dehydrogenase n=1 Tax=Penicillium verhagenii TaxID=1562060 RepID=UPI002544FCCC|nr:FAD/FMN-containing dehydrogenase [Penicillium verhagenii]KAJ5937087.1 FAD/FMN-containing dehydrogenase [Penicillium verhagenii]